MSAALPEWLPAADASPELCAGLDALAGGRLGEAAAHLKAAPETATEPQAAYRLGVAQSLSGDPQSAIATWRRTLRLDAAHAAALYDLALACVTVGDLPQAALAFSRLLDLAPEHAEGRFNFGNLLYRMGRTEAAVAMYAPLTEGDDPPHGILVNLGRALRRLGRLAEADACYRRALLADPGDHFTHWNRSHVLFLSGRWADGFAAWEHRLAIGMGPPVRPNLPEWQAGPLPARLLAVGEQGHGDALQCLRYLPLLAERGCRAALALHPALAPLARELLPPDIPVMPFEAAETAAADAWAPLFSLPHRLGLPTPEAAPEPAASPAFAAGIAAIRAAAPDLGPRPRIGLVWAGNPAHDNDAWRSLPLPALAPLLAARPDAAWISLQTGEAAAQAVAMPQLRTLDPPADFRVTAQRAAALDLMISVDTAAAHLAATLGVRTWILLAAEPDWRWGPDRSTTPWYAEARLFRQQALGDWADPVARAADALATTRFPIGTSPR